MNTTVFYLVISIGHVAFFLVLPSIGRIALKYIDCMHRDFEQEARERQVERWIKNLQKSHRK